MIRYVRLSLAVMLLLAAASARSADPDLNGVYKLVRFVQYVEITQALIQCDSKDSKVECTLVASHPTAPNMRIADITLKGKRLRIDVESFPGHHYFFEGDLGAEKVLGSYGDGSGCYPAYLAKTAMTTLDAKSARGPIDIAELKQAYELNVKVMSARGAAAREKDPKKKAELSQTAAEAAKLAQAELPKLYRKILSKSPDSPALFNACYALLRNPENQPTPEEARAWSATLTKAAKAYGSRLEADTATSLTELLLPKEGLQDIALEQARRAESFLTDQAAAETQVRVLKDLTKALQKNEKTEEADALAPRLAKLEAVIDQDGLEKARKAVAALTEKATGDEQSRALRALRTALQKVGKTEEMKAVDERLAKLDTLLDKEYLAHMPPFKSEPFAGRKSKSNRAVVMELFTGAQCGPCVAADLGFDGLEKSYQPTDVILLQYHLHIPGPDPLANADTKARADHYDAHSTPTMLANGKETVRGGGPAAGSENKYGEYRKLIEPLLEESSKADIKLSARRNGNKIDIQAQVADLAKPSAKIKLRFVLVEETVHYVGSNRIRYHHHIVRAMPGGVDGVALKEKTSHHAVSVDLDELRQKLTKYLDETAKERPFSNPERPMEFKNLHVVALVQDDDSGEILQAVQVPVGGDTTAKAATTRK